MDALASLRPFFAALTAADLAAFLLRVTAIAVAGHLALAALRRAPAAVRHLAATAALAAMVVAPLAAALLPAWTPVRLPFPAPAALTSIANDASGRGSRATFAPIASATARRPVTAHAIARALHSAAAPSSPELAAAIASAVDPAPMSAPPLGAPGAAAAFLVLVTCALLFARMLGSFAAAWIARRSAACDDTGVLRETECAGRVLGLRRRVPVRVSERLTVPVVTGIARPTLIVPRAFAEWPAARRQAVLLHELAHAARHDGVALLVSRVATALYWFHPLAWSLARCARHECERACDDAVLAGGVRASDYADHLLAVARAAVGPEPLLGATLAFARLSSLEGRMIAILRADARRAPVTRRAVAIAAGAAVAFLVPLTSLRVAAAPTGGSVPAGSVDLSRRTDLVRHLEYARTQATVRAETRAELLAARISPHESDSPKSGDAPFDTPARDRGVDAEHLGSRETKSGADWYDAAKDYYDKKRFGLAGEAYENAARSGSHTGTAWYNAACSYALDGQKNRALGALSNALDEGFGSNRMLESDSDLDAIRSDGRFDLLVKGSRSAKDEAKAQSIQTQYEELLATHSRDATALRATGLALMRGGDPDRGAEAFGREFAIDSSSTSLYNQACAYAIAHRRDQALQSLERSVYAGYGDRDKYYSDDDLHSLRNDSGLARVAALAEEFELTIYDTERSGDRRWREELPREEKLVRDHPDVGRAWWNLGFVQLRVADPSASVRSFQRALGLGYRRGNTLYNLACAAAQSGDRDGAMEYLTRAEAAGMDVGNNVWSDGDLAPLRNDPRYREKLDRWLGQDGRDRERAKNLDKRAKEKDKGKD